MSCREKINDNNDAYWSQFKTWSDLFSHLVDEATQCSGFQNEVDVAFFLQPVSRKYNGPELENVLRNIRNWKNGTRPHRPTLLLLAKQLEIEPRTTLRKRWLELYGASMPHVAESNSPKSILVNIAYAQKIRTWFSGSIKFTKAVIPVVVIIVIGIALHENWFVLMQWLDKPLKGSKELIEKKVEEPESYTTITLREIRELHANKKPNPIVENNDYMAEKFTLNGLKLGESADISNSYKKWKETDGFPTTTWIKPLQNGHISFTTHNGEIGGKIIAIGRSFATEHMNEDEVYSFLLQEFGSWSGFAGYKSKPYWRESSSDISHEDCLIDAYDSKTWVLDTFPGKVKREGYNASRYSFRLLSLSEAVNDCGIIAVTYRGAAKINMLVVVDTRETSRILGQQREIEIAIEAMEKATERESINFD